MRYELHSGTDVAMHTLFDPAGVGAVPHDDDYAHLDALERDGRALTWETGADGTEEITVLVDEGFSDERRHTRRTWLTGGVLRVTSGTLVFTGAEYVGRPAERAKLGAYMKSEAAVPPGVYAVDVFNVLYQPSGREFVPVADADRAYAQRVNGYTGMGGFFVFAAVVGAIAVAVRSRPWAWKWPRLGVAVGAIVAIGGWLWWMHRDARMRRWKQGVDEDEQETKVVVELRRLAAAPAAFARGRFGGTEEIG